jgi:hypothetical protein
VKPTAEVSIKDGFVSLRTRTPASQHAPLIQKVGELIKTVSGIKGIEVVSWKEVSEANGSLTDPRLRSNGDKTSTFFTELG